MVKVTEIVPRSITESDKFPWLGEMKNSLTGLPVLVLVVGQNTGSKYYRYVPLENTYSVSSVFEGEMDRITPYVGRIEMENEW